MQPLAGGAALTAYHNRLRKSHDFDIFVDILNLDEQSIGSARLLDGQINITDTGPVRRTGSLTLSDPGGALDFSGGSAWNNTQIWVDRLVRVRHVVNVPGYGEITAIPFVGPPSAVSRNGAEVQVELQDKAALGTRGARPLTVNKGANVVNAIRLIMTYCTGEFRFRMPTTTKRLSKAYNVGWADEAAPFVVAAKIASAELGMQLLYSCDGYLLLRPLPTTSVVDVGYVTDQANAQVDFASVSNYVIVKGASKSKKVGVNTVTTQPVSSATAGSTSTFSPQKLSRQGVPRYLPLVISEDAYKTTTQTAARATAELNKAVAVADDMSVSVIPMFHIDADDVVTIHVEGAIQRTLRFHTGSIPLGVGGDMTIGYRTWVSRPAAPKVSSHIAKTITRPKKHPAKHKTHHAKKHH
jgi:hypothetical protein